MNRLLITGAALSLVLGTSRLAFAQSANPGPDYSGSAPAYGQPVPPPQVPSQPYAQPYAWQNAPVSDPHSSGTGGRAYYGGQKTN